MSVSTVILTKNEEENVPNVIRSVNFSDEIIVVDDFSSDRTVQISRKLGAKVYRRLLNNNFASQRNFGLSKAGGDWVLFVDADEVVSGDLAREIAKQCTSTQAVDGFYLKRCDYIWGKKLRFGEPGSIKLLRLVKQGKGRWVRCVHERLEVTGRVDNLNIPLDHYPHQSISEFVDHVNKWSSLHAMANQKEGKKSGPLKIIVWPVGHFAKNYFFRFGFLDGAAGFVFALLMSFHSFLAWSKLWLIQTDVHNPSIALSGPKGRGGNK